MGQNKINILEKHAEMNIGAGNHFHSEIPS